MSDFFPVSQSILSVEALKQLVERNYALPKIVSAHFWHSGLNHSYVFKTKNQQKYVFRIYRKDWRSLEEIHFELDVLLMLDKQNISVSEPLVTTKNELLIPIDAPEGLRYGVLFSYALGSYLKYDIKENVAAYGATAAQLHLTSKAFESEHKRFELNLKHLIDEPLELIEPFLSARREDFSYLKDIASRLHRLFEALPLSALDKGFCHGDLHGGNVHISSDSEITLFDFDCCGFGFRAYDLAVFRWDSWLGEKHEAWPIFIENYQNTRKLSAVDLAAIPAFVVARHFWFMGLISSNAPDWGAGYLNRFFDHEIKNLKKLEAEHLSEVNPVKTQ